MHSGNFVLILHTHLPWVLHHGGWPHGVDWLSEAVAECYIPLLNVFNDLMSENITPNVTLDISPVLCEQLEQPDFKLIFAEYCKDKISKTKQDEKDFKAWGYSAHHIWLTQFWQKWYGDRLSDFKEKYNSSVVGALKKLQDAGAIEIMTCGATHGYLPLLGDDRSVELQVHAAVENHKKHFGRPPRGIWLPECAYRPSYEWKSLLPVYPFHIPRLRPGLEQVVARYGIEYFVVDDDLTKRGYPIGKFMDEAKEKFVSVNSPGFQKKPHDFDKSPLQLYNVSSSDKTEYGTAVAFTRHHDIAMQVWSGEVGYPGEANYLDFHKKHLSSMLRYWRVTDNKADMMYKTLYEPGWTQKKIDLQSNHFIHHVENTLNWDNQQTGRQGTLCAPFDTELFGHWWFEGPEFLKAVLKGLHHSPWVNSATAREELLRVKPMQIMGIPEGSWGKNNNHDVWCNEGNKWTWEAIYNDEFRLRNLFDKYPVVGLNSLQRRILTQALRELMLLQSSDWQFLIFTLSAQDYAEQRFSYHHSDFNNLCDLAEKYAGNDKPESEDLLYLEETEKRNPAFPELHLEWWSELS